MRNTAASSQARFVILSCWVGESGDIKARLKRTPPMREMADAVRQALIPFRAAGDMFRRICGRTGSVLEGSNPIQCNPPAGHFSLVGR